MRRPPPPRPAAPRGLAADEAKIHGANACAVTLRERPDAVVRAWFAESTARHWAEAMQGLAARRRAYHVVPDDELGLVAGSEHHGGVCLIVRKKRPVSIERWLTKMEKRERVCGLALEGVGNPHNLGAILRTGAHFAIDGLLVADTDALHSGACARVAEGGLEYVETVHCAHTGDAIRLARRAGFGILTTSSHGGEPLYAAELPPKCLIVFGEESQGLTKQTLKAGDVQVMIPGSGAVESLNVSVAAAVIDAEWWRRFRQP
ncbi:MAG: tRNA/rRNA methyltransferase [Lysobacterales bacterium]|nr:MAG: tRNA/rRNA methyltransferase [Xanthomonadales bacterium]